MARHNWTPSHVAYVGLVLMIANTFMARSIYRRLCMVEYCIGNERPERHGRTTRVSRISCFLRSPWFAIVWLSLCPNWMKRINSVDDKLQFNYYGLNLRCCCSRNKISRLRSQFGLRLNNRREEGHKSYGGISTCFCGNIFVQKWAGPFRTWCTPREASWHAGWHG